MKRPKGSRHAAPDSGGPAAASRAAAEREDWTIERLVPGGDGMARLSDGRVGFVTGAVPGDVVRPIAIEAGKGHVRATRFALVTESPGRVAPPCPVARECGGCDWMTMGHATQLEHKSALLRDALGRVGRVSGVPESLPVEAVGSDLSYRSRVRFHVEPSGKIGFFARGTHTLVPVPRCVVCRPELNDALAALRRAPVDALAAFSAVDVRASDAPPRVVVRLTPRVRGGAGLAKRTIAGILPAGWVVSVEGDADDPSEEQTFPLPRGMSLGAAPGVFTQVNWAVNEAVVTAVTEGVERRSIGRFLDAYAGAGNFSLPLLALGLTGVSVDSDGRAIASARRQAAARGLDASGFQASDAARFLAGLARASERFDLILIDPPRSGAKEVLGSVASMAPAFVAYCSCDPVTLARDLATLERSGYALEEVRAFDMFPHTHHLESLAWLRRTRPADEGAAP